MSNEQKTLYRIGNTLVSEDLSIAYYYDGWCKTPAAAEGRKKGWSGSSGSFAGRNFQIGIDTSGNPIMSEGVWYDTSIDEDEKEYFIKEINNQKGVLNV